MYLNINKEDLLNPLTKVIGVIERRQTLPVLSNVYLLVKNNLLTLIGTDLEVQISAKIQIDCNEGIKTTLPGRKLLDICRSLPDESKIKLNFQEGKVLINSGKSRFVLRTLPAAEYPLFDELQYINEFSINRDILFKAFTKTLFCMAQQDVRYYLNGLMLQISNGDVQAVASDGHRLALFQHQSEKTDFSMEQIILPRKGAQEVLKLLDKVKSDVDVKVAKSHINLTIDDVQLNAKLIDGRFPDFKNVLPEESEHNFSIDKQLFKSALSRVSILSNEKYKGIRLDLSKQLMTINANNPEQDEADEEVTIDYDGEKMSMGFNSSYLMDALNVIESDLVYVSFTDTNSSCLLEDPTDKSSRFVIMPMRL